MTLLYPHDVSLFGTSLFDQRKSSKHHGILAIDGAAQAFQLATGPTDIETARFFTSPFAFQKILMKSIALVVLLHGFRYVSLLYIALLDNLIQPIGFRCFSIGWCCFHDRDDKG